MNRKAEQRGVALLFALGMLALLLVSGLAFVTNSITARKIAANNSGRSQARIFAQSALNRAMASIMLYQYQVQKSVGEFPENFDCIRSYNNDANANDGLTGNESLLKLPTDDTIVSEMIAKKFNKKLAGNDCKWVYFFNNCDTNNTSDREVIGRAAWMVVSHSPQISAPVFLSGHLPTDGTDPEEETPNWYPAQNRWGREIDEMFVDNTPIFLPIKTAFTKDTPETQFKMQDYDTIFKVLEFENSDDAKKRWIEDWFIYDPSDDFLKDPTPIIPEVYSSAQRNSGKLTQLMRFNISELSNIAKYGISAVNTSTADPWYARFGIDSVAAPGSCNTAEVVEKFLTADSPGAALDDTFDFNLNSDDRPSLPFLRRIGNADADNTTFKDDGGNNDVASWRKQIAANFNDYCDKDNIPTSDVPATEWHKVGTTLPKFTGNEKTPYIYELGYTLGIISSDNTTDANAGFAPTTNSSSYSDKKTTVETSFNGFFNLKLHAKLANIYPYVKPAGVTFKVDSFPKSMQVQFKPTQLKVKINYTYGAFSGNKEYNVDVSDTELPAFNKSFIASHTFDYSGDAETKSTDSATFAEVDNSGGALPYPVSKVNDVNDVKKNFGRIRAITFNVADSATGTYPVKSELSFDDIKKISNNEIDIPGDAVDVDVKIEAEILKINVEKIELQLERVVLNSLPDGETGTTVPENVDFVRGFEGNNALKWEKAAGDPDIELDFSDSAVKQPQLLVGGISNYDPRQNLNPGDWKIDKLKISTTATTNLYPTFTELKSVMSIDADGKGVQNLKGEAAFSPYNITDEKFDFEQVGDDGNGGPGWIDDDKGTFNAKRLSTAFIRNAPMMSPWEIGFIHRGIKWQTINLKKACDPDNNAVAITLQGHKPHKNSWTLSGTSYAGGDGAILDQIKMTDKCATYGKINVNRLRTNNELFKPELDLNIAKVLFENIRIGENINQFFNDSKRTRDFFNTAPTGTPITAFTAGHFGNLTVERKAHTSRANFIHWSNGHLENAFGAASGVAVTDAGCEEIIGKTVNLICAENSSPSQIKVVVVAQAIRDVGGTQFRKDADGDNISLDCEFGKFDLGYDEITGEVKMLVTVDRDITTGRLFVSRIDYLE